MYWMRFHYRKLKVKWIIISKWSYSIKSMLHKYLYIFYEIIIRFKMVFHQADMIIYHKTNKAAWLISIISLLQVKNTWSKNMALHQIKSFSVIRYPCAHIKLIHCSVVPYLTIIWNILIEDRIDSLCPHISRRQMILISFVRCSV